MSVIKTFRRSPPPAGPASPATLSLRLRVRLHRADLDCQLADGLHSDALEDRALRARQLAGARQRRRLARSLRRLVTDAERPALGMYSAAVPVCRSAVWPMREGLLGLAERLESPVPINPCGVARLLVTFTDGMGPFYNLDAARSLADTVWWIADGLAGV